MKRLCGVCRVRPAAASELNRVTRTSCTGIFGMRDKKISAAAAGPIVCELEGPNPVLYMERTDCMKIIGQKILYIIK